MRALLTTCLFVAACGGGGGTNDGDGGGSGDGDGGGTGDGDGGGNVDAPPAATLDERLTVSTIVTPAGVMAGDSNWRIWGRSSLRVAPVFTQPYADCGTLVGFTTTSGTGTTTPTARVARLNAQDGLVTTHDLGAFELRGLAVEPDGHFGALLWDATQNPPVLHVRRYDTTGAQLSTAALVDALAAPTDFDIGESRLEFGDGKYGAYYHVHGISGFANGHEGDQLKWVSTAGAITNGWSWGCSHSMSEVLRYEPTSRKFLSACVTDCFPGSSGDFATSSIGGVYLDHARKVMDLDAGCNGSVAGELGSGAVGPAGWKLIWNTHQNPATPGQSSYNAQTMNQDIAFATVATNLTPGAVVWLTTTPVNEQNSSIARWQPMGDDTEQYVVGWNERGTAVHKLAIVSPAGTFLASPVDVGATAKWGERDDPFRVAPNGDIVWAWFDAAGATSLKFARISSGRTATCAAL
ncbi:MAG TPA: hypothetical protein VM261_06050 [Kofleriaceae bacterium]|nr:hypothetical protein [Kofleriaceae bacterium]